MTDANVSNPSQPTAPLQRGGCGKRCAWTLGGVALLNDDVRSGAIVVCHNQVKDKLKAPSTAKFPRGEQVVAAGVDTYEIDSYVDAENGFGAMIRTPYTCTAIHGEGLHYQVRAVLGS